MYTWCRGKYYFYDRKFVTIYVLSTLHDKTEFCMNVKFGSVALAFHYDSCFNAS